MARRPIAEPVEDEPQSKLQAASIEIARGEWARLRSGVLSYDGLHPENRELLESVAMKGLCVGMVLGGISWDGPEHPTSTGEGDGR